MEEHNNMNSMANLNIIGMVKIFNPITKEVFVDKRNAIHYENFSIALAQNVANKGTNFITEMHFGSGGTTVDPTGVITYLPPNVNAQNDTLYNQTYSKIVDDTSTVNLDKARNRLEVRHVPGQTYTDILVTCLLDYGEPAGQQAYDNSTNFNGEYVFDELGLQVWMGSATNLMLTTHVIFHPVQKSLNRQIQIDYTLRISTLTNLSSAA
jgi:hypothetical protein